MQNPTHRDEEKLPSWLQEADDPHNPTQSHSPQKAANKNASNGSKKKVKKKTGGGKPNVSSLFGLGGGGGQKKQYGAVPIVEEAPTTDFSSGPREKPRVRDTDTCTTVAHDFFLVICTLSISSSLCMLCSQIVPLFFVESIPTLQLCLRIYISIFCLVFILAELEWTPWIRSNRSLNNFLSRGIIYSFVGLVGMEESVTVALDQNTFVHADALSLFITISSWFMTVMGGIYFMMGVLCMKRWRDKIRERRQDQIEKARERMRILQEEGLVV